MKVSLKDLEARPTVKELFKRSMDPVISTIEEIFSQLDIYGCKIYVRKYPDENYVKVLIYALMACDPEFGHNYKNKSQQKNMFLFGKLFYSKDHFQDTPYRIEFRVCGKEGCSICTMVGRYVRRPNTADGSFQKEVMQWLDNPIPVPVRNNKHYLSPEDTIYLIEPTNSSLEYQMKCLPEIKNDDEQNRLVRSFKEND